MNGESKKKITALSKTLLIIFLVIVILAILAFDVRLMTVYYMDSSPKINSSIRIALVTDLHSCYYGEKQSDLVDAINKEKPDIILLGGDIFDDDIPYKNAEIFMEEISKNYRCYYVTGNHEFWSDDCQNIISYLEKEGVTVLHGSYDTIKINNDFINICGVDDPDIANYKEFDENIVNQLEELERVSDNKYYTILLAHRPEYIDQYLQYGFDMVLCGHAHGGQWRLPGFINGLYAPGQGFFPKYAGGEYEFKNGKLIVSRGLARESTRIPRIFNRPELVIINLK